MVKSDVVQEHASLLTIRQVSDILQVHHNTVRRWIAAGRLPAYRLGPRGDLRLKQDELDDFILQMRIGSRAV